MRQFRAVIFDMDGVIFDSEQLIIRCWAELSEQVGIPDLEETLRLCIGTTAPVTRQIVLDRYGADFPYDAYVARVHEIWDEHVKRDGLPVKPGVRELMEWLRKERIPVALASSTRRALVEKELLDAGLLTYFDALVCGDMVAKSKPAPDIFLRAAEALSAPSEACIVIEDSYNGIRAAHAAGMFPIMVPDLLVPTEEMERLSGRIEPSLSEVLVFLEAGAGDMRNARKEEK